MANKRITDVDSIDSLSGSESFFINRNNTIRQVNKSNVIWDVSNGGTGVTTLEGLRSLLKLGDPDDIITIDKGGTNAKTPAEALKNLGAQAQHTYATINLSVDDWEDNIQTISVNNATETNTILVSSHPDSFMEYAECRIRCIGQDNGTLTFACEDVPTNDLQANVIFME